jgi:hypothetical protein
MSILANLCGYQLQGIQDGTCDTGKDWSEDI